eukprot:m51a1_g13778 hypothetical protein (223) ;mRNA; f:289923-290833
MTTLFERLSALYAFPALKPIGLDPLDKHLDHGLGLKEDTIGGKEADPLRSLSANQESAAETERMKELLSKSVLDAAEKKGSIPDAKREAEQARKQAPKTAGKGWFDLPATPLTPEILRDMKLIHMRTLLDRSTAHKRVERHGFRPPKFFEIGTVVPGAAEHFTAGTKRSRRRTVVQQVLENVRLRQDIRSKFSKLVTSKKYGGRLSVRKKAPAKKGAWKKRH